MADDQVKYSDLIVDDGAIDALDKRLDDIKKKMAEVKGEAATLTAETRNLSTATREQQQATSQNAAAAENLRQRMKGLTEEQKRLEAERRKYAKLTEEEANRVKTMSGVYQQYAQAVRNGTAAQMSELKALDLQNKSYNELYQTYNALKDALNQMTVAERQNTAAGQAMTNQAKEIRDTLNNLQQATGNYALNVGNYMSAFNGLQFQTQQLLREIPSAVNVKQFFLAISNNIPMFTDALMRYNKGIPEIKVKMAGVQAEIAKLNAELATMNVQTAEYEAKLVQINALKKQEIELQQASVGGWRAILKSVGSWQTMVIVGLVLLQKYGTKIIDLIKNIGKGIKDLTNQINLSAERFGILVEAGKNMSQVATELDIVLGRLKNIDQGTQEWVDGVETINNLTGQHVNALDTEIGKLSEIVEKYKEMARVMEVNKIVISKLADAEVRSNIYHSLFYDSNASGDELMRRRYDADYIQKMLSGFVTDEQMEQIQGLIKDAHSKLADTREKARKDLDELYYKYILITSEQQQMWKDMYQIVDPNLGKPRKEPKTPKDPVANQLTLQRQLEDQIIANIENEYKRLDEEETKRHERFIQDQEAELAKLAENDPRRAVINQMIEEENRTHERKMEEIDEKRYQNLQALTQKRLADEKKAAEEEEKQEKENAKGKLKAAVDGWAKYKAKMVEEGKTRKQIVEAEVAAEIARLNLMLKLNRDINGEKMSDEQKTKVQEWINLLEKLQQTGNYGDYKPGQFMGKGGANVTNERKNYANIWEVLGIDMDNNQVSALNSVFDQAKEALNSWMDARKAAADQAKELADDEVSAAENALNREIELRNQGYANDVALREKELADAKAAQKKAAEEQKKVAQEQVLLDAALQTSSMITASANIIKQFPNPLAWAPMLALMWGTFAYAKTKAYQASTKSIKFKEGGVMLLEGGSHESGHDVNLGVGPDGSNLRAEGGEYFAVINKRSSRKYGSQIPAVVNALNSGMFEDRYIKTSDAVGLLPQVIRADNGTAVDLSSLEGGVDALVKQGEQNWTIEGGYRVLRYKNLTRRVKVN